MQQHTVSMGQRQFRIGDLANELKVKKFVIRFWEQEFGLSADRSEGGHRFYTTADLHTFQIIKDLLHNQGYTIEGARKQLPLLLKNNAVEVAPVVETEAAPTIEIATETKQILTALPVLEVIAPSIVEVAAPEEISAAECNVQPAVEEREASIAGAHVDPQEAVRTCNHAEFHTPVSVAPCSTCEKHSRHLAFVKDELQELVKRLR